jgi:integrase
LERIILHEGRHSAASAFIAAGEDAVQVAAWLGHSQTSTTTDIYAKAFKDRERQAAKRQRLEAFYAEWGPAE